MDSDDEEMFTALLEEEAEAAVDDEEHLMILASLADLFARNTKPLRGARPPQEQGETSAGGLLHALRRLLRRRSVARRDGISAPFQDEAEALSRYCACHPGVRQLIRLQEGLYRHNWILLTPEMHGRHEDAGIRISR